jgi:hypothetical protein
MVVALGIYLGPVVPDLAVAADGEVSVVPPAGVTGLREIIDSAQAWCRRPHDRLAVSYPASWDPLHVDRLLREVRAADIVVQRYVTSAEAAVRWWLHRHADVRPDGVVMVREVIGESSMSTFVAIDGLHIETVATSMIDPIATLFVDVGDHVVALGTALTATL